MKKKKLWILCIIIGIMACFREVPLNEKEFISLLIDIHMADATLSVWHDERGDERTVYMYYNDIFNKYGISKSDFDSCMRYYVAQPEIFGKIYAVVMDTLNRRMTNITREWNILTANDSINLFPGYRMQVFDTLGCDSVIYEDEFIGLLCAGEWEECVTTGDTAYLNEQNPFVTIEMNDIVPGMYKFNTILKFDHKDKGKRNRITSYFLSDQNDTLKVHDVRVSSDSIQHHYAWTHYVADSAYRHLVIRLVESENLKEITGIRSGKIWKTEIFKQYTSPKQAERYKEQYSVRKR